MIYFTNPQNWDIIKIKFIFNRRQEINSKDNPQVLMLSRLGVKVRDISTNVGQLAESYDRYHIVKKNDLLLNPMDLISGANCSISLVEGVISPAYINLYSDIANTAFYDFYFKNLYWLKIMFINGKGVSVANRWTINNGILMNLKVLFPNIDVQQKIAIFLKKKLLIIEDEIAKNNKCIYLMEEYKKSLINKSVETKETWAKEKMKNRFSFKKGLSITKENLVEDGVAVINYGQIHSKLNQGSKVTEALIKYVPKEYLQKHKNCLVNKNDFIFADTSEDLDGVGNNVYVNCKKDLFAGYHTIIASPANNENTKYFAYLFKSDYWRQQLRASVFGIKLFSITQKLLKECMINIPPSDEQEKIVDYLDEKCDLIDKIINYRKQLIEKIEEYKKSLIYEAVTGKIEV